MREITMWCPRCELWTKEYSFNDLHDCGTEVITQEKYFKKIESEEDGGGV